MCARRAWVWCQRRKIDQCRPWRILGSLRRARVSSRRISARVSAIRRRWVGVVSGWVEGWDGFFCWSGCVVWWCPFFWRGMR